MKRVDAAVERMSPDLIGKRVLEPACGCGEFAVAAAEIAGQVVCSDLDEGRLSPRVKTTPGLRFERMDAACTGCADGSFDTVVLYNAIGHLAHIAGPVLRECRRVVGDAGAIWIVSSFRMDKAVIRETVLPLLEQMGLPHSLDDDSVFTFLRIPGEPKMRVSLAPMTRERMHSYFRRLVLDPDLYADPSELRPFRYDRAQADAFFDRRAARDDCVFFAVLLDGRVVGDVGLKHIDTDRRVCELSVHLTDDSVKNRGVGTRAEALTLDYAFGRLGMQTVVANVLKKNTRSRRVLEKLGFRQTGEDGSFCFYALTRG